MNRLRRLAPLALVTAAACLVFRDLVFRSRYLYQGDVQYLWMGKAEAFRRVVQAGALPLWNPYSSFGEPMLGMLTGQVMYPPTWLLLVMEPWRYYSLYVVSHIVLWALGLYALGRQLGASPAGAAAGALVGLATGPLISIVYVWNHLAGVAWMPWVVAAGDRALAQHRKGAMLAWGAALAMCVFVGYPEPALLALVANAVLATRFLSAPRVRSARPMLLTALGSGLFAVALSAVQWGPGLVAVLDSGRVGLSAGSATEWSLPPVAALQLLLPVRPDLLPLRHDAAIALYTQPARPLMASLYLGLPALMLVAAAIAARSRAGLRLVAVGGVGMLVALGNFTPLYGLAVTVLPPLAGFRHPVKGVVLLAMSWAVLSGLGVDAWSGLSDRTRRVLAAIVGLLGLAALLACTQGAAISARWLMPGEAGRLGRDVTAIGGAVLLAWAAAAVALVPRAARMARHGALVVAAVATTDLLIAAEGVNPTVPASFYADRPALVDALRVADGSRLHVVDYWVPGFSPRFLGDDSAYAVRPVPGLPEDVVRAVALRDYLQPAQQAVHGFEVAYEKDEFSFQARHLDSLTRLFWFALDKPDLARQFFRLGAVSRVVALHEVAGTVPGVVLEGPLVHPVRVFRVADPVPRAYVVSGVRTPRGSQQIAETLFSFDVRREVVLTEDDVPPREAGAAFVGICEVRERRPDRIVVDADLTEPGHLVLVDTWDGGWQATVDGRPAPIRRANVAFQAVPLAPGRHRVELVYRPLAAVLGACASAIAVLGTAFVLLRTRRGKPPDPAC